MILTKENLQEWKKELDKYFFEIMGLTEDNYGLYSETEEDAYWLESWTEFDHKDAVLEEISYWD